MYIKNNFYLYVTDVSITPYSTTLTKIYSLGDSC